MSTSQAQILRPGWCRSRSSGDRGPEVAAAMTGQAQILRPGWCPIAKLGRWRAGGRSRMNIDFDAFDADNHYYEATDAFTRHLPARHAKVVQWAEIGGKPRMVVDNKLFRFIPNPTFDPVARPGCLDDYFRGKAAGD